MHSTAHGAGSPGRQSRKNWPPSFEMHTSFIHIVFFYTLYSLAVCCSCQQKKRRDFRIFLLKSRRFGTPGETRTHYIPLRRRTLYPGEVRGHLNIYSVFIQLLYVGSSTCRGQSPAAAPISAGLSRRRHSSRTAYIQCLPIVTNLPPYVNGAQEFFQKVPGFSHPPIAIRRKCRYNVKLCFVQQESIFWNRGFYCAKRETEKRSHHRPC